MLTIDFINWIFYLLHFQYRFYFFVFFFIISLLLFTVIYHFTHTIRQTSFYQQEIFMLNATNEIATLSECHSWTRAFRGLTLVNIEIVDTIALTISFNSMAQLDHNQPSNISLYNLYFLYTLSCFVIHRKKFQFRFFFQFLKKKIRLFV